MPNKLHRAKRVRQSESRRARNRWRKRTIKDKTDGFMKAIQGGDVAAAEAAFKDVSRQLDKVSSTSTMHKNTAARRKSRMSRRLRDLKQKA